MNNDEKREAVVEKIRLDLKEFALSVEIPEDMLDIYMENSRFLSGYLQIYLRGYVYGRSEERVIDYLYVPKTLKDYLLDRLDKAVARWQANPKINGLFWKQLEVLEDIAADAHYECVPVKLELNMTYPKINHPVRTPEIEVAVYQNPRFEYLRGESW